MSNPFARTRNKQVVRVLQIVASLQAGYWSTGGLARTLGVSERTIRRDMNAIRHAKVKLKHDGVQWCWSLK